MWGMTADTVERLSGPRIGRLFTHRVEVRLLGIIVARHAQIYDVRILQKILLVAGMWSVTRGTVFKSRFVFDRTSKLGTIVTRQTHSDPFLHLQRLAKSNVWTVAIDA